MKILAFFFLLIASQYNCDENSVRQEEKFVPAKTRTFETSTSRDWINALTGHNALGKHGCKKDSCDSIGTDCKCCEAGDVVAHCCCDPKYPKCNRDSGIWMCSGQGSVGINVAMVSMLMSAVIGKLYFW